MRFWGIRRTRSSSESWGKKGTDESRNHLSAGSGYWGSTPQFGNSWSRPRLCPWARGREQLLGASLHGASSSSSCSSLWHFAAVPQGCGIARGLGSSAGRTDGQTDGQAGGGCRLPPGKGCAAPFRYLADTVSAISVTDGHKCTHQQFGGEKSSCREPAAGAAAGGGAPG